MSARDPNTVYRETGKLYVNPTSVSIGLAGYGTELGALRGVELELMKKVSLVKGEEWRGIPVEGDEGGEWAILYVLFRSSDDTVISTMFANTSTDASGSKGISAATNSTNRAGGLLSARAKKILFVPDNAAHRAIYFPLGAPIVVAGSRIAKSIFREAALEASFVSLPDASQRTFQYRKLAGITL